jgi:LuxR family maltose regulon positive regulatory protein
VRAFISAGRFDEAEKLLILLSDYGKSLNRPIDEAEALILFSVLGRCKNNKKQAEEYLTAALLKLCDYGYITLAADEGAAVEPTLKRILNKVNSPDYKGKLDRIYVNEVLMAAHAQAKLCPNYLRSKTDSGGSNIKLSRRQKDMLLLLSKGVHTSEICRTTGLSLSTVKTHLYFTYKKLGVGSALDAVLKARELGIL